LFEQLGPTFIKVGQILAGRPDLVPPEVIRELEKLQDQVPPVPFAALKPIIEEDLGRPLAECFLSFDPEPLATASIAQVHVARTLAGEEVVVKVKKPDVDKALAQDFEILEMLAMLFERYAAEVRVFRPHVLVNEFRKSLLAETNFTLEASNIKRFADNFASNDFLVVPKVYPQLSGPRVITLQRLHGVKLSDLEGARAMGVDPREVLTKGMDCFFQSMLVDGFFHGDPHAGNILVLADGRLGLIDFGAMGRLSQKAKDALVNMFLALLTEDYELLVHEYISLSSDHEASRSSSAIEAIQRDVADAFSPYHGLPLKDVPMGKLLMEGAGIAYRHRISIPRDLIMVFKAIMTLEGIGRTLNPDFDIISAASKQTRALLRERYAPKRVLKDLLFVGRDLARFMGKAPRQIGEALRLLENGELRLNMQITNLDALAKAQVQGQSRIALAILASGVFVGSVLASSLGHLPIWSELTLWACSGLLGLLVFWRSFA
ncbi:MAG: AarF/ABC1/UbiB kinase family protein, partial [Bdellovibrionales bacterium]|nr:AarF/ABC1/UbiB kinase family protein [Bdellovibrionales bacterium]